MAWFDIAPFKFYALILSRGVGGAWARHIAGAPLAVFDNGAIAVRLADPPPREAGALACFVHPAGTGICFVPSSGRWRASPDLPGV